MRAASLGLLLVFLLGGCSSPQMEIYNTFLNPDSKTRGTVKVTMGSHSVEVEAGGRGTLAIEGEKVVTTSQGKTLEEVSLTGDLKGKNLIYNVQGLGHYYLADYSACYVSQDTNKRASDKLRVVESLYGKKVCAVPPGNLVPKGTRLPAKVENNQPVIRVEEIDPNLLRKHTVEQILGDTFYQEIRYRNDVKH